MWRLTVFIGFALSAVILVSPSEASAPKISRSDSRVKATATAAKIDADGKQVVTITLEIEKGWHLYANPVNHNNEFLDANQTSVKIVAKEKIQFGVKYPVGRTVIETKDKYDVYDGSVKIEANVVRSKADQSPLEVRIAVQAASRTAGY